MASSSKESRKVLEGIIAVNKPQWSSSAGVIRDLQNHFATSDVFKPWLDHNRRTLILHNARSRLIRNLKVKLGHGGTLDPLATGVLIVGVGKGTKLLSRFLECTKSYECVVVFGAATDSYDAVGKVVSKADYSHVTKELVESKLADFRGKIMQKPSIFSALKVDGKKMYEYAREGGEIPEVAARPVEVTELELVEWLEPGTHEYSWPKEEMDNTEKEGAEKLLGIRKADAISHATTRSRKRSRTPEAKSPATETAPKKQKLDEEQKQEQEKVQTAPPAEEADNLVTNADEHPRSPTTASEPAMSGALVSSEPSLTSTEPTTTSPSTTTAPAPASPSQPTPPPPAARLRMTVTSGFYVRSLCHDLGRACSSLGFMASLVRSRQGDYALGSPPGNVIDFAEFEHADGKAHWEPLVKEQLEKSMEKEGWEPEICETEEEWKERSKNRKKNKW
ncbi:pseudouridine synthase [Periconia macrospinosa]|uniref:tRNA pseudouridine(55) synthase n=1 Tax=Periconia macrospinosa TaxID=97972 RepID=A0A2V1E2B3_9PLEO|nr:pseudouridine synthase [Periconia macrospinosa]